MSQISSRLREDRVSSLGTWTLARPSIIGVAGTAGAKGRAYLRRLFGTDLLVIALVSSLPAIAQAQGSLLHPQLAGSTHYYVLAGLVLTAAWMISLRSFKAHCLGSVAVGMQEYKIMVYSGLVLAGFMGVLIVLTGQESLKIFLLLSLPLGLSALLTGRWTWRQWLGWRCRSGYALSNVLVYGQPDDAGFAVRQISKKSGPAYRVVGVLMDGAPNLEVERAIRKADPTLPLAYDTGGIEQEVNRLHADSVVVAGPLAGGNEALQQLGWKLESSGAKLIVASSLIGVASRRVRTSPVDGMPLLHVELAKFTGARYFFKRGFDIVFSVLALLALSPVFLVIALLIRRDGPGKVFYVQERAGQDGRPFKMIKFRTMVQDAEARLAALQELNQGAGPLFKVKDDPRITRCGHWLRKHSLDELPQFVNVLRGDMSVVGPRPALFTEVESYEGHTRRRLLPKPGVTGLWQVSGRSNLEWKESVRLDLYYAENWTVLSDLRIIWRTFRVMIESDGAY
ncbi:sugar transferase [Glutamicibacter sp. 2E12]|uniref:sugar transferase n=1 Tax=Glutamicibacter sp. 2E12 TaxID=3416181 RepID=UPI003CF7CDA3